MHRDECYVHTGHNPFALPHDTIYKQLRDASTVADREALDRARAEIEGVGDDLTSLRDHIEKLQHSWQAPSTDLGVQAIGTITSYAGDVGRHAGHLSQVFGDFLDTLDTVKVRVPEPVDPRAGTEIPIVGPVIAVEREIEHRIRTQEARELYAAAYRAAMSADQATPALGPPPVLVVQHGQAAQPAATDKATAWPTSPASPAAPNPPPAPTPPALPSPPTLPAPPAVPGSPALPVANPPAPGIPAPPVTPVMPTPVAPTPPSSAGPGATPIPAGPGASADGRAAPRSTRPGAPPGHLPGGPDRQAPGPGGHDRATTGPRHVTMSRPGGAPAGFGPIGAGASRGSADDAERKRPAYLVADDPNELIGDLTKTAPPVIGESRQGSSSSDK